MSVYGKSEGKQRTTPPLYFLNKAVIAEQKKATEENKKLYSELDELRKEIQALMKENFSLKEKFSNAENTGEE